MKRAPELRDLSADHHHGLVLARKAARAAADGDAAVDASAAAVGEAWREIEAKFRTELEPHFAIEENVLAPLLHTHGESALVARLLDEHRVLREYVAGGAAGSATDLARFGKLLDDHIRFEERELFEIAQQLLTPEELGQVAEACRQRQA